MNIIFFGTPDFVVPVLEALLQTENCILKAVVTAPDKPVGRQQILTPTPVKAWAQAHQIPVFTPEKLDDNLKSSILNLQSDLFVVAAYGQILPPSLLALPEFGALNLHPSLLPKYRGSSPIQTAIANGDAETGMTIMKMDERVDSGPIVWQAKHPIGSDDTFESLCQQLFQEGADALIKILPAYLKGEIELKPQNETQATYTKILKKEDGYFALNQPPGQEEFQRKVRAYYPWPSLWTKWQDKVVKFYPGNLIQIEGKNKVKMEEFLRGYPDFPLKY